jgi:hypothetical protein
MKKSLASANPVPYELYRKRLCGAYHDTATEWLDYLRLRQEKRTRRPMVLKLIARAKDQARRDKRSWLRLEREIVREIFREDGKAI